MLALDGKWQKLDQIRILMGDEVTKRTHRAFAEGIACITGQLDDSIEREKAKNDFLSGVPAIVQAIGKREKSSAGFTQKVNSTPRHTSPTPSWQWWARLRWLDPAISRFLG